MTALSSSANLNRATRTCLPLQFTAIHRWDEDTAARLHGYVNFTDMSEPERDFIPLLRGMADSADQAKVHPETSPEACRVAAARPHVAGGLHTAVSADAGPKPAIGAALAA